jgi:hypothetical protein
MGVGLRTFIVVVVAVVCIVLDRNGFELPSPPGWMLTWAGWIVTGWALTLGPELTRAILHLAQTARPNR